MAQSSACCNPCQNPLVDGKNKLVSGTSTEDSNRCTIVLATTRVFTPIVALVVAPLVIFGSANSFVVRYLENDLQQIVKIILEARPLPTPAPTPVLAPVIAAFPHYERLHERPLKAHFSDIYQGKTYLKYYTFFQQCKDHFATADATGPNRVPFTATFLKDTALFHWQQHQRKIKDQTNVPISWKGFKAFFCQSLGKSEAFVDTIQSIIWKIFQHQLKEVIDRADHLE